MMKTLKVTLLVAPVMALVSLCSTVALAASASAAKPAKVVMRADQLVPEVVEEQKAFNLSASLSRSVSLIDHEDGSRGDGMEYLVIPQWKLGVGTLNAKIIYSQNLRDDTGHTYDGTGGATDWGDIAVSFAKTPYKWMWSYPYMITLTPSLTAVIPVSQNSVKRDQLQTAISTGLTMAIIPDGVSPKSDGNWNFSLGISAGRNFHEFETNIMGKVLNRYSSNQTLGLGYSYKKFSVGFEFMNKSRWTYENNTINGFAHSEEIGYEISDNFNVAVGHTNEGSALKANGVDSNLELVDENSSSVYATLGFSF